MRAPTLRLFGLLLLSTLLLPGLVFADPCGMVPPITATNADAIARVGAQKTYVFYKNGVESFVIRPGFTGKVKHFGMLIPFPTPPAIRKVPDHLFSHIAAAVDPPEVRVYLRSPWRRRRMLEQMSAPAPKVAATRSKGKKKNRVRVLRQEAVGMYQVAVLEAGSAKALKLWMDQHKYRYPKGMDKPVEDYVKAGWCFVAVKTRVSGASGVKPRPGMRKTTPVIPDDFKFDGHVQGMGFRFKSKKLVVPMRLSTFNPGSSRNIVYLLTDDPQQIQHIPTKYVVRQIGAKVLNANLTGPLPLRVYGMSNGEPKRMVRKALIKQYSKKKWLVQKRNPTPHNGLAYTLFASDLASAASGKLMLNFEEIEKSFVNIGELLQLRGPALDTLHREALTAQRKALLRNPFTSNPKMTLTIVDGDFSRDVLARENLSFRSFTMPTQRNTPKHYNARLAKAQRGWTQRRLYLGGFKNLRRATAVPTSAANTWMKRIGLLLGVLLIVFLLSQMLRRVNVVTTVLLLCSLGAAGLLSHKAHATKPTPKVAPKVPPKSPPQDPKVAKKANPKVAPADTTKPVDAAHLKALAAALTTPAKVAQARAALRKAGPAALPHLWRVASTSPTLAPRGWAIATMAQIGGPTVNPKFVQLYTDTKESALVRTWAAAAHLMQINDLASFNAAFTRIDNLGIRALNRPVGKQLLRLIKRPDQANNALEVLLNLAKNGKYRKHIIPLLIKQPTEKLVKAMLEANDDPSRRVAAGVLASFRTKTSQVDILRAFQAQIRFSTPAKEPPWGNGALFIPRIPWVQHKPAAKQIFGHLIAWFLWCDVQKNTKCQRQIHNNIRSWSLARAVGYRGTWRMRGVEGWLRIHKKTHGFTATKGLFTQQKLSNTPKYQGMRKRLGL